MEWLVERLTNLLWLKDGQTVLELYAQIHDATVLQVFETLEELVDEGILTQKYNRYYLG